MKPRKMLAPTISHLVSILLILTGGCGSKRTEPSSLCEDEASSSAQEAKSDVCQTPECVIAAGSLLASMDRDADPCDSFYQFACGNFELQHSIPAGESQFNQYNVVDRQIQRQLRDLLQAPGSDSEAPALKKARRYFKSCLDVENITANAIGWFQRLVDKMGGFWLSGVEPGVDIVNEAFSNDWSLNKLLRHRNKFTLNGPFSTTVGSDEKNVLVNIIKLEQEGLGLGKDARDYYIDKNVSTDDVLVAYTDLLAKYAALILGRDQVKRELVTDVVIFEQELAGIHRPQTDQLHVNENYFKTDIKWLQKHVHFIDWLRYFNDLFRLADVKLNEHEPVLLYNADYFKDLTRLMRRYTSSIEGKRTLQNYFVFRAVSLYAPYLGGDFQAAKDEFMAVFVGKKGSLERWQTCVTDTDSNVGFGLAAMYVEKYFPATNKIQSEKIISEVIDAFRTRIKRATWMDRTTRTSALDKINALLYDVAYPEWVRNVTYLNNYYANLVVTDDYVENQFLSFNDANKRILRHLREKPDPQRWLMTPQTINAYYEPTQNKVAIPAGILNRPYFYPTKGVPASLNYGAIGCVAGHEISHGFDYSGREFDKLGNLHNWWTNVTRLQFEERVKCLVEKFDAYQVGGIHLRGEQTVSENIADDAGIKASYQAYRKAKASGRFENSSRRLVGVNLTDDQLFFVGWAQQWCAIYSPKMIQYSILQDAHTLFLFRVIGPLSNSPEFSEAFQCPSGSPMNPQKKCSVW